MDVLRLRLQELAGPQHAFHGLRICNDSTPTFLSSRTMLCFNYFTVASIFSACRGFPAASQSSGSSSRPVCPPRGSNCQANWRKGATADNAFSNLTTVPLACDHATDG